MTDKHKSMMDRDFEHQLDEEATRASNDPRKAWRWYAYTCPNCGSGQNIGGTCNICMFKVK